METAYKIVCVYDDGTRTSCSIKRGPLSIDYEPHKWTAKRKYGPMVFPSMERAKAFVEANFPYSLRLGYYEVWECDAENVRQCNFILPIDAVLELNGETVRKRMDTIDADKRTFLRQYAPTGTYITSRVRLTRKVW